MFVDDEPIVLPSKVKLSTFNAVNVPNEVILEVVLLFVQHL